MSKRLLYNILDRGETLVLQEVELVKTCGGWRYLRCPKSGLEWHVNGLREYGSSPTQAWNMFHFHCYAALSWLSNEMFMSRAKEDHFLRICLLVRQIELARQELDKLTNAEVTELER